MRVAMRLAKISVLIIGLVSLTAHADLVITKAWIKNAPPVVPVRAAYLTFENTGSEDIEIKHLSSPSFGSVEMHETKKVDGIYTMLELKQLIIPAHSQIVFQPKGKHIMLMMPKQSLAGIKSFNLEIETNVSKQHIDLPVKESM